MKFINYLQKLLIAENMEDYYEVYYTPAIESILYEFRDRNQGDKQNWSVVPFPRVKKIWEDYMKVGVIRDEKGMNSIAEQIVKNISKLQANTMLAGHEQEDHTEYLDEYGIDQEDFEENFGDFIRDEKGQLRISDYGLDKLVNLADKIIDATTAEKKLVLVDKVFNVVHQRSDLPKMFVQGGTKSLNTLAGK